MFPYVKLGEVGNGTSEVDPIELNKFVVLVSAERSADVADREGRLVLRAQSPSTRMQPADLLEFLLGARARRHPAGVRSGRCRLDPVVRAPPCRPSSRCSPR